jgi:hypothetical protein
MRFNNVSEIDKAQGDWDTCPWCNGHGYNRVLADGRIHCGDCGYEGVPHRREWTHWGIEQRWSVVAGLNGWGEPQHQDAEGNWFTWPELLAGAAWSMHKATIGDEDDVPF